MVNLAVSNGRTVMQEGMAAIEAHLAAASRQAPPDGATAPPRAALPRVGGMIQIDDTWIDTSAIEVVRARAETLGEPGPGGAATGRLVILSRHGVELYSGDIDDLARAEAIAIAVVCAVANAADEPF
ncbi:MAG: hypothetical protein JNM13_15225 [Hyphomicrobiaceae bacterium]|nr:hypothetical protein [Hyphomicrobiaceae bacterium]